MAWVYNEKSIAGLTVAGLVYSCVFYELVGEDSLAIYATSNYCSTLRLLLAPFCSFRSLKSSWWS